MPNAGATYSGLYSSDSWYASPAAHLYSNRSPSSDEHGDVQQRPLSARAASRRGGFAAPTLSSARPPPHARRAASPSKPASAAAPKLPELVQAWSRAHVLAWLRSERLFDCSAAFLSSGVNGVLLLELSHRGLMDRVHLSEHDAWRVWAVLRPLQQQQTPARWRLEDEDLGEEVGEDEGSVSDEDFEARDSRHSTPGASIMPQRALHFSRGGLPTTATPKGEGGSGGEVAEPEPAATAEARMISEIRAYVGHESTTSDEAALRAFAAQMWRIGLTPNKQPQIFRAFEAKAQAEEVEAQARALLGGDEDGAVE